MNLDNCANELIAAMSDEAIEDEIISDNELFTRLAVEYCRWSTTQGYPVGDTFLCWATTKIRREHQPANKSWEEEVK